MNNQLAEANNFYQQALQHQNSQLPVVSSSKTQANLAKKSAVVQNQMNANGKSRTDGADTGQPAAAPRGQHNKK